MSKEREDGEDLAGLCIPKTKRILIHVDSVDYGVIVHELFHAYVSDLHLDDTNDMSLWDIEEIFASLFAAKGEKIIKQAKRLTKDLKKLQEKDNE